MLNKYSFYEWEERVGEDVLFKIEKREICAVVLWHLI